MSKIQVTGLCHSVQGTAEMLANWIGATMDEITYVCAGINHQAWYVEFKTQRQGRLSADPQGRGQAEDLQRGARPQRDVPGPGLLRHRVAAATTANTTGGSASGPDLIKKYCSKGTGWNPGKYAYILEEYRQAREGPGGRRTIQKWFKEGAPFKLERGHEYAAYIINACLGGDPFQFNGNVPNTGLITNLPHGVCVEVPVLANRSGLRTPSTSARCRRSAPR